jgi:uncharacterized MAPEG superfamily protein
MTIFFMFAWVPVSVGKAKSFGRKWIASNRSPLPDKELIPWAARCERAHNNLKDNFPAFIAAILLLGHLGKLDQGTTYAALIFVFARLAHYFAYGMGNVPGRAVSYALGLGANLYLLVKIF